MNHRIAAALLLAALVAGACSGGASPEPAPAPDEAQLEQELIDDLEAQLDSGPQLETLNYIRQQVDTRVAADIALITDELRWGPGGWIVETHPDEDWFNNRQIHVTAGRCYIGSPDSNATTNKCGASNTTITVHVRRPDLRHVRRHLHNPQLPHQPLSRSSLDRPVPELRQPRRRQRHQRGRHQITRDRH